MTANGASSTRPDHTDMMILSCLQEDAWAPQSAVAEKVGLSEAAVHHRIAKLSSGGFIRRFTAVVDPDRAGFDITAFVEVHVEPARHEGAFIAAMQKEREVQEVHHVTGEFSLLLKIRTRDRDSLQRLLLSRLTNREGVRRTRTVIVLSSPKEETALPLFLERGKNAKEALR